MKPIKLITRLMNDKEFKMLKIEEIDNSDKYKIYVNLSYVIDGYSKEVQWDPYDDLIYTYEETLKVIDYYIKENNIPLEEVISHGFGDYTSNSTTITYSYKDSNSIVPLLSIEKLKYDVVINCLEGCNYFVNLFPESEFKDKLKCMMSKIALGFSDEINEEYIDTLLIDHADKYMNDDLVKTVVVETERGVRAKIKFSDDYDPCLFDIITNNNMAFIRDLSNYTFMSLISSYFSDKSSLTRHNIYTIINLLENNLNVLTHDTSINESNKCNTNYEEGLNMRKENLVIDLYVKNLKNETIISITGIKSAGLYTYDVNIDAEDDYIRSLNNRDFELLGDVTNATIDLFARSKNENIQPQLFKSLLRLLEKSHEFKLFDNIEDDNYVVKDDKYTDKEDVVNENNIGSTGKSNLTFDDVIGMDEVKDNLRKVVKQYKNFEKYKAWNIKPIGGVLLYGPSGTGKSYIAEAFANEIDATFIKLSAGDIMSKYIGASGKNIKKAFEKARKEKFALIYIDEVDFIANKRGSSENDKERNATLNELLVQMSSMDNDNIFMVFATNMMELLDPAFLRSGRCDFKLEVSLPDFECRKGILEYNSKGRPLSDDVDFTKIARNMTGMNCADMSHVANEAARRALELNKDCIEHEDFEVTLEEMICGKASKTTNLSEKEKNIVAYHEVGHLVANEVFGMNKTKKISIIPRGKTLGFVLHANEEEDDVFLRDIKELRNEIMVCLAGRAAEDYFIGAQSITGGCSNDLEKATSIATKMVTKYGMSDSIGLVSLNSDNVFMKSRVNKEVKDILDTCYSDIKSILARQEDLVNELVCVLKDKEELTGDEIEKIINTYKESLGVTC